MGKGTEGSRIPQGSARLGLIYDCQGGKGGKGRIRGWKACEGDEKTLFIGAKFRVI